jgi:hypothetical protein
VPGSLIALVLVVLMSGEQPRPRPDTGEQCAGDARVFGRDEFDPAQGLGRARTQIIEVTDRGRHYI